MLVQSARCKKRRIYIELACCRLNLLWTDTFFGFAERGVHCVIRLEIYERSPPPQKINSVWKPNTLIHGAGFIHTLSFTNTHSHRIAHRNKNRLALTGGGARWSKNPPKTPPPAKKRSGEETNAITKKEKLFQGALGRLFFWKIIRIDLILHPSHPRFQLDSQGKKKTMKSEKPLSKRRNNPSFPPDFLLRQKHVFARIHIRVS